MRSSGGVGRRLARGYGFKLLALIERVRCCAPPLGGCLGFVAVLALACSPVRADQSAKEKELDKFLRAQESKANSARAKLTKTIDRCIKEVRQLPIDQDNIELRIRPLREDRVEFINGERLPVSPEVAEGVGQFVAAYSNILESVSKRRAAIEKANADAGPDKAISVTGIKNFEARLTKVVGGGGDRFTPGSTWQGKRQFPDATMNVTLVVKERAGTSFTGELFQSMGGGRSGVNVQGKILGNQVAMESTSMIVGKNRYMYVEGVVVQDRFIGGIAQVAGGKPTPGSWFILEAKQKR